MKALYFVCLLHITASYEKPKCLKQNICETKGFRNTSKEYFAKCSECKGWACYKDGIMYISYGCKNDDEGICKSAAESKQKRFRDTGRKSCSRHFYSSATCARDEMNIDSYPLAQSKCTYEEIPESYFDNIYNPYPYNYEDFSL